MQNNQKTPLNFKGKKAVILGLGKSGLAAAKFLHARGAHVKVSDIKPRDHLADAARELAALEPAVEFEFGANSLEFFSGAELVVYSPSVASNTQLLVEMRTRGATVLTQVELALRELDVPLVTVTGAYGKTTVVEMIRVLLDASGKRVHAVSDLHGSMVDALLLEQKPDVVVAELSDAELERSTGIKPTIAVLTSLFKYKPVEYPTIEDYYRVSMGILRHVDDASAVVYNYRDPALKGLIPPFPGKKLAVRRKDSAAQAGAMKGSYMTSVRDIHWTNGEVKEEYDLRYAPLFGLHNKDNLAFAINVARELNCPPAKVQEAIHSFKGVPHRLELVKKRGGVRFINDSRSTHPESLGKALEAFALEPVILIAGGKQSPDSNFAPLVDKVKNRVKTLILVGESKEQINRDLGDYSETFLVGTFEEGILLSFQKSREGDVILLSPGCESYDMFTSYEERGTYFRKYLDEL